MEDINFTIIALVAAIGFIIILVVVILFQRRKINDLERPKYGFLGKPLAVFVMVGLLSGTVGFALFLNQQDTATDTISADREVRISISVTQGAQNAYTFSAVPIVDGVAWDNDPSLQFDIFWTVTNDSESQEFVESRVSQFDPSSLTVQLDEGNNEIEARIVIQSRIITETVNIVVE